jgi:hypothetical protein
MSLYYTGVNNLPAANGEAEFARGEGIDSEELRSRLGLQ